MRIKLKPKVSMISLVLVLTLSAYALPLENTTEVYNSSSNTYMNINYSIKVNLIPHHYSGKLELNKTNISFDSIIFDIEVNNTNNYPIDNLKVIYSLPLLAFNDSINYLNPNETRIISKSIKSDVSHYKDDVIYRVQIVGEINGVKVYGLGEKMIKIDKPITINSPNILFWMILIIIILLIIYYITKRGLIKW